MLGDNRVHMLRAPEDADSGVGILRRSLESAFEALELRYLRSMSLAIFSGPEDDPDRKLFEAFNCESHVGWRLRGASAQAARRGLHSFIFLYHTTPTLSTPAVIFKYPDDQTSK